MKELEELNTEEKELLLKFPAYISLLAFCKKGNMDEVERKEAIKFSHIKTYACKPILFEFYQGADSVFADTITALDKSLPEDPVKREIAIRYELEKLEKILQKLGKNYASVMHESMHSFKEHVSKAHRNVLEFFVFPVPIKGISE